MLSLNLLIIATGKRALTFTHFRFLRFEVNIKQAIQGLFTAGTSERKEKVGGKRGLKYAIGVLSQ